MSSQQKNITPEFYIMSRIRPPNKSKRAIYSDLTDNKLMYVVEEKKNLKKELIKTKKEFKFDSVFDIDYTNEDIFKEIARPMVENFVSNCNGTFFVYGQTGSGKTHTTLGTNTEVGFLEYALNAIKSHSSFDKTVYFVCIQIHNNKCYDIFNENKHIMQYEDAAGKIHLRQCVRQHLEEINVHDVVSKIKSKRMNGISSENDASSRSHLLIQIWGRYSFLNILDMAGSEKASKSVCKNRVEMMENAKINESILALKECIRAVKMGKKYVPYRHNNLTKILKDVFFGNGMSYIMATVSPEVHNIRESINTLSYISDMKTMKRQLSEPTYLKTIRDLHVKHHESTLKSPRGNIDHIDVSCQTSATKGDGNEHTNSGERKVDPTHEIAQPCDDILHQTQTVEYFMRIINNCERNRQELVKRLTKGVIGKYSEFKKQMKSIIRNEIQQLEEFENVL